MSGCKLCGRKLVQLAPLRVSGCSVHGLQSRITFTDHATELPSAAHVVDIGDFSPTVVDHMAASATGD